MEKVIAKKLFIAVQTVKFHKSNIYKKCGVKSKSEFLVKYAIGGICASDVWPNRQRDGSSKSGLSGIKKQRSGGEIIRLREDGEVPPEFYLPKGKDQKPL